MHETIEILDEQGNFTGKPCLKSDAHKRGIPHPSIQVWFYKKSGKILLQKRIATKETHPSLWDVSVAGHITFGETPILATLRESKEELGLKLEKEKLVFIQKYHQREYHPNGIIDDEFNFVYGYLLPEHPIKFQLQKSEVTAVKWMRLDDFQRVICLERKEFVPRKKDYYPAIFQYFQKCFD